jgi:hypothetical protein
MLNTNRMSNEAFVGSGPSTLLRAALSLSKGGFSRTVRYA